MFYFKLWNCMSTKIAIKYVCYSSSKHKKKYHCQSYCKIFVWNNGIASRSVVLYNWKLMKVWNREPKFYEVIQKLLNTISLLCVRNAPSKAIEGSKDNVWVEVSLLLYRSKEEQNIVSPKTLWQTLNKLCLRQHSIYSKKYITVRCHACVFLFLW